MQSARYSSAVRPRRSPACVICSSSWARRSSGRMPLTRTPSQRTSGSTCGQRPVPAIARLALEAAQAEAARDARRSARDAVPTKKIATPTAPRNSIFQTSARRLPMTTPVRCPRPEFFEPTRARRPSTTRHGRCNVARHRILGAGRSSRRRVTEAEHEHERHDGDDAELHLAFRGLGSNDAVEARHLADRRGGCLEHAPEITRRPDGR